jgi:hypothetical protein
LRNLEVEGIGSGDDSEAWRRIVTLIPHNINFKETTSSLTAILSVNYILYNICLIYLYKDMNTNAYCIGAMANGSFTLF